jgi:hypothetical protein
MLKVYVVLASERSEHDPGVFHPRALVVCDDGLRPVVYRVVAPDGQTGGSQTAANAIIVPIVKKWLREKNLRNYEICVPQVAPLKLAT